MRRGTPLRQAHERAAVHEDMPVAPGLGCYPFHRVVPVAADLKAESVAFLATGAAASAHLHLDEDIAALDEGNEILMAAAVDAVLSMS